MQVHVTNDMPNEAYISVSQTEDDVFVHVNKAPVLSEETGAETPKLQAKDCAPGAHIRVGSINFVVLNQNTTSTLLLTEDCVAYSDFGKTNNWFDSKARKWCENEFIESIKTNIKQGHIVSNIIDTGYAIVYADSALLNVDLYNRYREYIPLISEPYWTISDASIGRNSYTYICTICPNGEIGLRSSQERAGLRPCIYVSPDTEVEAIISK